MPLNAAKRLLPDRGQSLVETVVMLPVLLMVFLGLDYFYELVSMRARAIEGARFATWESSWYLRDDGTQGSAVHALPSSASDANLDTTLKKKAGIGRFLLNAEADAATRKVADYDNDVTAALGITSVAPRAVADVIVPIATAAATAVTLIDGAGGQANSALSGLGSFLGGVAGVPGFFLQDLFARETNWDHEADSSIFTARVEYKTFGINYFHLIRPTDIVQFSSILSHPLLIVRTNDKTEYEQLVGGVNSLCDTSGHIFPLWFLPTGDPNLVPGVGAAVSFLGNTGKCMFSGIGGVFSAIDSVLDTNAGFHLPDGTLKEFPERH